MQEYLKTKINVHFTKMCHGNVASQYLNVNKEMT